MRRNAIRLVHTVAVCASAALFASACVVTVGADQYTEREEKRFQASGTPELSLGTFDGSIEVRSWDRPEVLVEIEKRAADKTQAAAIQVDVQQSGNAIRLEIRKPSGAEHVLGFRATPSAKLVASVPRQCNLVVRTGDGSITVERIDGKVELHTDDGSIRGQDLTGSLRAHTGDGSLRFDDVAGRVDLDSGDGGARLSGKLASVRLRTGDGSVEVRAEEGSSMADDWEIRTGDGGMRVELPDSFSATLDASTSDGSVRVNGFGEPTTGGRDEEERRDLRRELNAGGRVLRLRSGGGSITVRRQ